MRYLNVIQILILMVTINISSLLHAIEIPYERYVTKSELEALSEHQKKGLGIAIEQDLVDRGWKDSKSKMVMVLRNSQGAENRRELKVKALEVENDGDKGLTIFHTPKAVKGTAFLTYSHTEGPDDQWLFLPTIKRVKRINSRNKSGPFMGSEFSFEDLTSFEVVKYNYNYLRDETIDNDDYYVVERFPKDENSGYKRIVWWVEKNTKRVLKANFYDRKNVLLKTLERSDYELYLDKYWRAKTLMMTNHQTEKTTLLSLQDIELNTGLDENQFSKNSLKRSR